MAELKELAEFYARAAAMKDPVIKCYGEERTNSPDTMSLMENWTVEERQPDFQCLIDSGIDCEFSTDGKTWDVGKLVGFNVGLFPYSDGSTVFKYCRPRLNHVHAWIATEDSKCPVPDGYSVPFYRANGFGRSFNPRILNWTNSDYRTRIVAFEVLPL